jgi:hypothetical protein
MNNYSIGMSGNALINYRICKKCQEVKAESCFYVNRKSKSGLMGSCKLCVKTSGGAIRKAKSQTYYDYRYRDFET